MKKILTLLLFTVSLFTYADEGMWLPSMLSKKNAALMRELGLKIPVSDIYSSKHPSLKDAIVSFGGFCSGVVVSDEGLLFTNHHCGFDAIQQHSTVEHDYLKDGFVAHNREKELHVPGLYVSFLIGVKDVTGRVMKAIKPGMDERSRQMVVDSVSMIIQHEIFRKDSTLHTTVDAYYGGNEYYLSLYEDYEDIRLVFAPPSSVGKFGGDTDNWVWPRHTGDFSVFRIYANKNNEPAPYSQTNVPYRPRYVAPISLSGYQEGNFCMTMGYPGNTERYLSSFGVEERMNAVNEAMIGIRGVKQGIWKKAMEKNDSIRIKYASKYATSANYWKNSRGMNKAIRELGVIGKKQELEAQLVKWIQADPVKRGKYLQTLTNLKLNYQNRFETVRASSFFSEAFVNAPELISITLTILNFDFSGDSAYVKRGIQEFEKKYADMDLAIDKEVFVAMLKTYEKSVDENYLPDIYGTIYSDYNGNYDAFAEELYNRSRLTTPEGLRLVARNDSIFNLFDDPAAAFTLDLIVKYYDMGQSINEMNKQIDYNERMLNAAVREMEGNKEFYPDANSTMRISVGIVSGYSPADAVKSKHYTTTKGIFEKVREYKGDRDFEIQPALIDLFAKGEFGRYAASEGNMNVCFTSNNDITGGNSGSGMFNAHGELVGLAFDGNWEAMSSDIIFEPNLQRCIGVDVRYMLFLIEKYGKAAHLIKELRLKQ